MEHNPPTAADYANAQANHNKRNIDVMERRITALEARVAQLERLLGEVNE